MAVIRNIHALEILDSRGWPTVRAEVQLDKGQRGHACVPSGASTGSREARELRDGEPARYRGKGVRKAVAVIHEELQPLLKGCDPVDQQRLDQRMIDADGTDNKARLGANAILAVSLAAAQAAAQLRQLPLYAHIAELLERPGRYAMPVPLINVINGGRHADNGLDIQEFMIQPLRFPDMSEALRCGAEIFHALGALLRERELSVAVGDEGGFAPQLCRSGEALELLGQAVQKAGYRPGEEVFLALDCAANEFYRDGAYHLRTEGALDGAQLSDHLEELSGNFPLSSIEDGMAEDDWDGWTRLSKRLGKRLQLVGDDLFVTQEARLRKGIAAGVANAVLIKPNQVGSLSETLHTIRCAEEAGYGIVISHRSGETEDCFIADLAVGSAAGQIKTGSICRSERVAKYNRLLQIAAQLGEKAPYAGASAESKPAPPRPRRAATQPGGTPKHRARS